ncbi:unnamed protein product, partial [Didymodactylos carnosus]
MYTSVGIGGLSMLVPLYVSEITTKEIRGRILSLQNLALSIGMATGIWIVYGTSLNLSGLTMSWRLPLSLKLVPVLCLVFSTFFFFPFSPRWLLGKNRDQEAMHVLKKLRRTTNDDDVWKEYDEIKQELLFEQEQSIHSYAQLFRYPLRRRLILGIFIQLFQQFTGINSILYYAPAIFKQAGLNSQTSSLLATGINGVVNILATIPVILLIDRLGRRFITISGALLMGIAMITIGVLMSVYGIHEIDSSTNANTLTITSDPAKYTIIALVYVFVAAYAYSWGPCG